MSRSVLYKMQVKNRPGRPNLVQLRGGQGLHHNPNHFQMQRPESRGSEIGMGWDLREQGSCDLLAVVVGITRAFAHNMHTAPDIWEMVPEQNPKTTKHSKHHVQGPKAESHGSATSMSTTSLN